MSGDNVVLARNTDQAPRSPYYSQTVAFSHYNNFSAQLPIDPKTGELVSGGVEKQAEQCFRNIRAIAESIGHSMNDVIRITVFVTNIEDVDAIDGVYRSYFPTYLPARTTVAVAALPMDASVFVEALLSNGEGTIPNAPQAGDLVKLTNNTANAPIDALSTQTVAFSHYNNISAQLPIDPETGTLVSGGVAEQTAQCLKNIKAIIESVGHAMGDAVKVNICLRNIEDLDAANEAYAAFFPEGKPARRVIGVGSLPMGALVQIDAIFGNAEGTPPTA